MRECYTPEETNGTTANPGATSPTATSSLAYRTGPICPACQRADIRIKVLYAPGQRRWVVRALCRSRACRHAVTLGREATRQAAVERQRAAETWRGVLV